MIIKESIFIRILKHNNKVIVFNEDNGLWVKISAQSYSILREIINQRICIEQLTGLFSSIEDETHIHELIVLMLDKRLLVNEEECEKSPTINEVSLILTDECNLKCIHCCQDASHGGEFKQLSFEQIIQVVEKLKLQNLNRILITGGEPMIRDDFFEISEYVKGQLGCKLSLITNGLFITKSNVNEVVKYYDSVSISLDGIDEETSSFIRGKGVYSKVVEVIKMVKNAGNINISVSALLPESFEVEDKFINLCETLGVLPEIRYFSSTGRGAKNSILIRERYDKYMLDNNYQKREQYVHECVHNIAGCGAYKSIATIDCQGNLYPCNLLQDEAYKLGNLMVDDELLEVAAKLNDKSLMINKTRKFSESKCSSCNVNLFCWSCLSEYKSLKDNEELFDIRCNVRKPMLERAVWGV